MNIALCYENLLPARGGCETYISDLIRSLVADGHEVHLYAVRWDAEALPQGVQYHLVKRRPGPRFLRPWRFAAACNRVLDGAVHDVSIGFDKTWGQDVMYPQGGLYLATAKYNLRKYASGFSRAMARISRYLEPAHWSFRLLERRQYFSRSRPTIVAISEMVAKHFARHYGIERESLRVIRAAVDPARFALPDRPKRRQDWRKEWGFDVQDTVGLFAGMNYWLKGLEPLLHAVSLVPRETGFRLLVAGSRKFGPYERLAHQLGIADRVRFLGPRRDMHHCYFAADLLVHPTFYDPCSLVVLEALACGLPVVTSRHNGAAELLAGTPLERFVIHNPHDHAELAAGIVELLDPAVRSTCVQAARRAGASWTFQHHYRALLQVLGEAALRKKESGVRNQGSETG
jgi:UDP-glucose:(heptosyl)LPS alpha-1,3-glucosyltransferase